jgi:hypothetical protein
MMHTLNKDSDFYMNLAISELLAHDSETNEAFDKPDWHFQTLNTTRQKAIHRSLLARVARIRYATPPNVIPIEEQK